MKSSRTVVIASPIGLHARVAARFVQRVASWHLPVTLGRVGAKPVNAASMIGIMSLNIKHGEEVVLETAGPGADEVLDDLVEQLSSLDDEVAVQAVS